MDAIFFEELNLPKPQYNLNIGSADHGNQTGRILVKIEEILLKENPSIVLSQGDTNTVLAGILAASKQNIPTGHVEAGLRSYDRRMPEEKTGLFVMSYQVTYLHQPVFNMKSFQKKVFLMNEFMSLEIRLLMLC